MHDPLDIGNFSAFSRYSSGWCTYVILLYPWCSFGKHAFLDLRFWILMLLLLKRAKTPWRTVSSLLKQMNYNSLELKGKQKHKEETMEKD